MRWLSIMVLAVSPARRSRRMAIVIGGLAVGGISCTPMRQANFADAEPGCANNQAACEALCRTEPGSGGCDVARVAQAEQIVAKGAVGRLSSDGYGVIHMHVSALCQDRIARACAADEALMAARAKTSDDRTGAGAAPTSSVTPAQAPDVRGDGAANAAFQARVSRLKAEADDAATFFGPSACRYGMNGDDVCPGAIGRSASAALGDLAKCGPRCAPQLGVWSVRLDAIRDEVAERKAAELEKTMLHDALDGCKADLAACQRECIHDAASNQCVALAVGIVAGDPHLVKSPDPGRGMDVLRKGCAAGNNAACNVSKGIEAKNDKAWVAVEAVGDRLASTRYTLAMVLQLRPTPHNQRDVETARRLEPGIIAEQYCPARAAFIEQAGVGEFRRRVAAHCKDAPPTAQGPTGAQVPIPQECSGVFALPCPGSSAAPVAPTNASTAPASPTAKPPTCVACPAGSHSEGKMGAPACWCTTGDPTKDASMSLNISPPSPSCRPAGACDQGCAFTCP
jgi:hypothetical protein